MRQRQRTGGKPERGRRRAKVLGAAAAGLLAGALGCGSDTSINNYPYAEPCLPGYALDGCEKASVTLRDNEMVNIGEVGFRVNVVTVDSTGVSVAALTQEGDGCLEHVKKTFKDGESGELAVNGKSYLVSIGLKSDSLGYLISLEVTPSCDGAGGAGGA